MQANSSSLVMLNGPPPASCQYSYRPSLYQRREYLQCQKGTPDYSFCLIDSSREIIDGLIYFHRHQRKAISQLYAPFGSFMGRSLSKEMSYHMVEFFETKLASVGIEKIVINHPASFYQIDPWEDVLRSAGYSVHERINHHLLVDDHTLDEKLHKMEKRKLARSEGFSFSLNPPSALHEIYEFIASCRHERGQTLSMTLSELQEVVSVLPEHFILCAVQTGKKLAAASVVVKVNDKCWYQFYPAHSKEFNSASPLVYLISELYKFAGSKGVKEIDLGTSEVGGAPIDGLLVFKDRLGGIRSPQCTYSKNLGI